MVNQMKPEAEEMYNFISSVLQMAKEKEVFSNIHLKDVDTEMYMKEMKLITDTRVPENVIQSRLFKYEQEIMNEKTKKKPNLVKLKKFNTLFKVNADALDFIDTYKMTRFNHVTTILEKVMKRLQNASNHAK